MNFHVGPHLTQPVATAACGMAANFALATSCANVTPPAPLTASTPAEPSEPVPDRITRMPGGEPVSAWSASTGMPSAASLTGGVVARKNIGHHAVVLELEMLHEYDGQAGISGQICEK